METIEMEVDCSGLIASGKWHEVLLMDESEERVLSIGFFGWTIEKINAYIQERFAKSELWVKFKMIY